MLVAYLQLVLGSQLRHIRPGLDMATFRTAVWLHLFMAGVLAIHVLLLAGRADWSLPAENWIRLPALGLVLLLAAQLVLGAGTG